jgi:hypothetical protein
MKILFDEDWKPEVPWPCLKVEEEVPCLKYSLYDVICG